MEQPIPTKYQIRDKRDAYDFINKSFCNKSCKDLNKNFNKALIDNKLRESLNLGIELMLSGLIGEIWNKIITISVRNININNPKLPYFIYTRYMKYIKIVSDYSLLELRNNQCFRNLLTELIFTVSNSKKSKQLSYQKIKESEFKLENIISKFTAKNNSLINDKLKYGDPEETIIILNEFNHSLLSKNYNNAVYWLSWIFEWEKKTKKNKVAFMCGYREIKNIDKKYHNDIVWFIWEIIIKESKKKSEFVIKNIESLYKMYKYDYGPSKKKKRSYFFLFAIKYFTDQYYINKYPDNYHIMLNMCLNINNLVYDKIKYCINDDKLVEKQRYIENVNELKKKKEKKKENISIMKIKINKVDLIDNLILSKK